jgi:hypothetical protein
VRECCEELFITFFYSFKNMGGTSTKKEMSHPLCCSLCNNSLHVWTWCLMRFGIRWIGKTLLLLLGARHIPKECHNYFEEKKVKLAIIYMVGSTYRE